MTYIIQSLRIVHGTYIKARALASKAQEYSKVIQTFNLYPKSITTKVINVFVLST